MNLTNRHKTSQNITGVILAGGKSSRMGEDKATKLHKGEPFLSHVIKVLETFTNQIIIISDHKIHDQFNHPRITDIIPEQGPLGGIYTGLTHSKTNKNIVLSCDIPFIVPEIISNLLNHYDQTYDAILYRSSPLIGIYHKSLAKKFVTNIQKGQLSIRKNLALINTKFLKTEDQMSRYMENINTQKQYKQTMQWS